MRIDININGQPRKPNKGDWIVYMLVVLFAVIALVILISGLNAL